MAMPSARLSMATVRQLPSTRAMMGAASGVRDTRLGRPRAIRRSSFNACPAVLDAGMHALWHAGPPSHTSISARMRQISGSTGEPLHPGGVLVHPPMQEFSRVGIGDVAGFVEESFLNLD